MRATPDMIQRAGGLLVLSCAQKTKVGPRCSVLYTGHWYACFIKRKRERGLERGTHTGGAGRWRRLSVSEMLPLCGGKVYYFSPLCEGYVLCVMCVYLDVGLVGGDPAHGDDGHGAEHLLGLGLVHTAHVRVPAGTLFFRHKEGRGRASEGRRAETSLRQISVRGEEGEDSSSPSFPSFKGEQSCPFLSQQCEDMRVCVCVPAWRARRCRRPPWSGPRSPPCSCAWSCRSASPACPAPTRSYAPSPD